MNTNRTTSPSSSALHFDLVDGRWTARNAEAIKAVLDVVQVRARLRILDAADVERGLNALLAPINIPRKHFAGCRVIVSAGLAGDAFAKSYNGTPEQTYAVLDFMAGGWRVVDAYRAPVWEHGTGSVTLTQQAWELHTARIQRDQRITVTAEVTA